MLQQRKKTSPRAAKDTGDFQIGFARSIFLLGLPQQFVEMFDRDELFVTWKIYTFWSNMSNNDSGFG